MMVTTWKSYRRYSAENALYFYGRAHNLYSLFHVPVGLGWVYGMSKSHFYTQASSSSLRCSPDYLDDKAATKMPRLHSEPPFLPKQQILEDEDKYSYWLEGQQEKEEEDPPWPSLTFRRWTKFNR